MRIVVVGTRGFPHFQGGAESHCQNLYPKLVKLGCEVIAFTRKAYIDPTIREYEGVKLVALSTIRHKSLEAFIHTFMGVIAAIKYRPDILHLHSIGPSFFAPLARIFGMRVVMTSHGPNYKHLKWGRFAKLFLRFCEFSGVSFSNKVIAISQTIADEIKQKYKREPVVIPNGVAVPQILQSEDILKEYGLEKKKYILTVGRFVPEKGFHDLIEAFDRLQTITYESQIKNWRLVLVGEAHLEDRYSIDLKEKAKKNKNIILTGFLTGKPLQELYSHAGLFVLPSYYEGFSIALLEAMSYGLSCIVSDIPGNRNVELNEERYFKLGDIAGLTDKMREFMHKPLTSEEKSSQIRSIAQKYDWDQIAERTLEVYKKVIGSQFSKELK